MDNDNGLGEHFDDLEHDRNEPYPISDFLASFNSLNEPQEVEYGSTALAEPVDDPENLDYSDLQAQTSAIEELIENPATRAPSLHLDTTTAEVGEGLATGNQPANRDIPTSDSGGPLFTKPLQRGDEVDNAMSSFSKMYSRPMGFENPNFQCYMNSVLAVLASSRSFVGYIDEWYKPKEELPDSVKVGSLLQRISNVASTWHRRATQKTVNQVRRHFLDACMENNNSDTSSPTRMSSSWPARARDEKLARQHDASEFLVWLLESISNQLARDVGNDNNNSSLDHSTADLIFGAQQRFNAQFQFSVTTRLTCSKCSPPVHWRSTRSGGVREYTLQLVTPDAARTRTTLEALIEQYFNDTVDKWNSEECGHHCRQSAKTIRLQSLPSVLFVHAHRTKYNRRTNRTHKALSYVRVPEHLDLSKYLEPHEFGKDSVAKYRLRAIVSHGHSTLPVDLVPSLDSGHYVAVVRAGKKDDKWFVIDDERVSGCDLDRFNDSGQRSKVGSHGDEYKATPLIMLYELSESFISPGREPQFAVRPRQDPKQTSEAPDSSNPAAPAPNKINTAGAKTTEPVSDASSPSAQLFVRVSIGDQEFSFPAQELKGFDMDTEQAVSVDAIVKVKDPAGEDEEQYLDLMKAMRHRKKEGQWQSSAKIDWNEAARRDPKWKSSFQRVVRPKRLKRLKR